MGERRKKYRVILITQSGKNKEVTFPNILNDEEAKTAFTQLMNDLVEIDPTMDTLKTVTMFNRSEEICRWTHHKFSKNATKLSILKSIKE